jgi:uncharacterized damage-inducible protein DinB
MDHDLQQTTALLSRTPAALNALLRDLPGEWTLRNEGEKTWTVFDVIGHLVYCEKVNWMPRVHQFGKEGAFKRFDRQGHLHEIEGKTVASLLDEFAELRRRNLDDLRAMNLQRQDFELRAEHPVLGQVKLSELLATWATHDMTHLHQISRIIARQYREAVGPFGAFLGVLKCDAHGS